MTCLSGAARERTRSEYKFGSGVGSEYDLARTIMNAHMKKKVYTMQMTCMSRAARERTTANLIIIDARYHDFNGFPVVNWY
jgi:hypothetical protein